MLDRARPLLQDEAPLGAGRVHPPALEFEDEAVVVRARVIPEQREPEPAAPEGRPVARTRVAAGLRQHGDHPRREVRRVLGRAARPAPRRAAATIQALHRLDSTPQSPAIRFRASFAASVP